MTWTTTKNDMLYQAISLFVVVGVFPKTMSKKNDQKIILYCVPSDPKIAKFQLKLEASLANYHYPWCPDFYHHQQYHAVQTNRVVDLPTKNLQDKSPKRNTWKETKLVLNTWICSSQPLLHFWIWKSLNASFHWLVVHLKRVCFTSKIMRVQLLDYIIRKTSIFTMIKPRYQWTLTICSYAVLIYFDVAGAMSSHDSLWKTWDLKLEALPLLA